MQRNSSNKCLVKVSILVKNGGFSQFSFGGQNDWNHGDDGSPDEFESFFGRGFDQEQKHKRKQPPSEIEITCTLDELYNQKSKKVKFSRNLLLSNGSLKTEEKVHEIKFIGGCKEGTKITFEKSGDEKPGYYAKDVICSLKVLPHEKFTLDKSNLIFVKKLSLLQALKSNLNLNIQTLDGRIIKVPISERISPKFEKIVKGEGMPKKDGKGDLIIRFDIEFPLLNDQQKKQLEGIL